MSISLEKTNPTGSIALNKTNPMDWRWAKQDEPNDRIDFEERRTQPLDDRLDKTNPMTRHDRDQSTREKTNPTMRRTHRLTAWEKTNPAAKPSRLKTICSLL
jgi:hypothetical protein